VGDEGEPNERWRQLIGSLDPERNLRAAADLLSEAAASSERLLHSFGEQRNGADGRWSVRDLRAECERSFDQFAAVAKRFLLELPFGGSGNDSPAAGGARVAVIDGVGTTVVEIAGAEGQVRCGPLLRHDGVTLDASRVAIVRSTVLDARNPTYVVRVDVAPSTSPGTYHGQLVADGLPDLAVALKIVVVGDVG
jgi:hypothetical protein